MPGGTWRTMYEEVLANAGRPSGDASKAQRAIVDAIDKHAAESFFFNEREFRFDTVAGQSGYGEASGLGPLVRTVGPVTLLIGGSEANPIILPRLTWNELVEARVLQASTAAQPEAFSVFNGRLELFPTPAAPGTGEAPHVVRGYGVFQHGRLRRRHDGTNFVFFTSDGVTPVTDSYPEGVEENHWFDEGYTMIRSYAEYVMYAQQIHSQDGRAEMALTRYLEHYDALKSITNQQREPEFVRPWTG